MKTSEILNNLPNFKKQYPNVDDFLDNVGSIARNSQKAYVSSDNFKFIVNFYYDIDIILDRNIVDILSEYMALENLFLVIVRCPKSVLYDDITRYLIFSKFNSEHYDFLSEHFTFEQLLSIEEFDSDDKSLIDYLKTIPENATTNTIQRYLLLKLHCNVSINFLVKKLPYIMIGNRSIMLHENISKIPKYIERVQIMLDGRNVHDDNWAIDLLLLPTLNYNLLDIYKIYNIFSKREKVETCDERALMLRFINELITQKSDNIFDFDMNPYSKIAVIFLVYLNYKKEHQANFLQDKRILSDNILLPENRQTTNVDADVHREGRDSKTGAIYTDFMKRSIPNNYRELYNEFYAQIATLQDEKTLRQYKRLNRQEPPPEEIIKINEEYRNKINVVLGFKPISDLKNYVPHGLSFPNLFNAQMYTNGDNYYKLLGGIYNFCKNYVDPSCKDEKCIELERQTMMKNFYWGISDCFYTTVLADKRVIIQSIVCDPGKIQRIFQETLEGRYILEDGSTALMNKEIQGDINDVKQISIFINEVYSELYDRIQSEDIHLEEFLRELFLSIYSARASNVYYDINIVLRVLFLLDVNHNMIHGEVKIKYLFNPRKSFVYEKFKSQYPDILFQLHQRFESQFETLIKSEYPGIILEIPIEDRIKKVREELGNIPETTAAQRQKKLMKERELQNLLKQYLWKNPIAIATHNQIAKYINKFQISMYDFNDADEIKQYVSDRKYKVIGIIEGDEAILTVEKEQPFDFQPDISILTTNKKLEYIYEEVFPKILGF